MPDMTHDPVHDTLLTYMGTIVLVVFTATNHQALVEVAMPVSTRISQRMGHGNVVPLQSYIAFTCARACCDAPSSALPSLAPFAFSTLHYLWYTLECAL